MGKPKEVDDRFKKFGTVSFTAITKVNDFIGYLENGRVMGTCCTQCGRHFFPPRADCCDCLESRMDWFEVKGPGRLVTYSLLKFGPVGFDQDLPYRIALLDYGDFKVFGRIKAGLADDRIEVGMPMQTTVNRLPNGQFNYVFEKA